MGRKLVIPALIDYFRYRRRPGRFGNRTAPGVMQHAFTTRLPDALLARLEPGDILFLQTLRSWQSWLVMYLTASEISHVAFYVGAGHVTHATTSGVVREPVGNLLGPDRLLVACQLPAEPHQRARLQGFADGMEGKPFSWPLVVFKGLWILIGGRPEFYRTSLLLDVLLVFAAIVGASSATGISIAPVMAAGGSYLILLAFVYSLRRWFSRRTFPGTATVAPVDILAFAFAIGAMFHLADTRSS